MAIRLGAALGLRWLPRASGPVRPAAAAAAAAAALVGVRCFGDEATPVYTQEYFTGLIKNRPLVVFMKGDPSAPMCGFSRLVVQILHMHGLEKYDHYNILDDVEFKEGMKKFSDWPTFPQVYINGELVGGADIMLQLHQNGELVSELEKIGHKSVLTTETQQPVDT